MAQGDYRNASHSARQTLRANPRNLEACDIMADLAERSRSPYALDWRGRIVELAPPSRTSFCLPLPRCGRSAPLPLGGANAG
jgi:hypothetical protein